MNSSTGTLEALQRNLSAMFGPGRWAPGASPGPQGDDPATDRQDPKDWSSEDEAVLHELVLERNLKALTYRSNTEEKRDVVRWIFKPDVTRLSVRGARLSEHQDNVPFSFRRCCRLAGYRPDALREALRALLKRRGIEVPDA